MVQARKQHLSTLNRAQQTTLAALVEIDEQTLMQLTELTLPEIKAIQQEIAQVLPAGNLPAFILSGLVKLKGRKLASDQVRQDITALLRGLDLLPKGLYGMFIAGPATVLYVYQKLLQLAGKDVNTAFPQGTWQFYLQFGMREDSARHANETLGFHTALHQHTRSPDLVKMAASWVLSAIELLFQYDDLLATDWHERVALHTLYETASEAGYADRAPFKTLVKDWNKARPYHRPDGNTAYLPHRRAVFEAFLSKRLRALKRAHRSRFQARYQKRESQELAAYQEQMTLLASLNPESHQEVKTPIPIWRAAVGLIWNEHTYLISACQRDAHNSPLCFTKGRAPVPLYALPDGTLCDGQRRPLQVDRRGQVSYAENRSILGQLRPAAPDAVLATVDAILSQRKGKTTPMLDLVLSNTPRQAQVKLRQDLPKAAQADLTALKCAPILINWDKHEAAQPLSRIRQDHRGIGDHALTLFRTDRSMVFDQSHIFFDGMWGMAVSEIMTDAAMAAYLTLTHLHPKALSTPPMALELRLASSAAAEFTRSNRPYEATAESSAVDMEQIARLRRWLGQRGLRLTVNDLLILYRFIHASSYQPTHHIDQAFAALSAELSLDTLKALRESIAKAIALSRETPPALLIPMDASNVAPRERLFPTTFRNPMTEIAAIFETAHKGYQSYRAHPNKKTKSAFDTRRRKLLAYLKAFGDLLDALKAVTMRGESFNTATIRMLAHLPPSMQHLLDAIPQRIGVLNEIVKGNEVFSNVGRVAPGASLHRFISAKDDGLTKTFVWGFLTDNDGVMHVSLRDFRPFVPELINAGAESLAQALAKDYLDTYVEGLNQFTKDLSKIVALKV